MFPSAELIIACPRCKALAKVSAGAPGSSEGVIIWSDGFQDAPFNERPPRVTRCGKCLGCFWTDEAQTLGYLLRGSTPHPEQAHWEDAPAIQPLDEAGLMNALEQGLDYSPELELELRVAIWWRGNDIFRVEDAPVGHATSTEAISNMERFLEMMAEGAEDLLLFRAEALRQLGRFQEVEASLQTVCCSDYAPAKNRLLELARSEDRKLRKLFDSPAF